MQYEITSNEASAVVGLKGAMLNSLKKNDTEYLWQGDEEHWSGQAPVCFPIVGVLRNSNGFRQAVRNETPWSSAHFSV